MDDRLLGKAAINPIRSTNPHETVRRFRGSFYCPWQMKTRALRSWNQIAVWLREMETLRREAAYWFSLRLKDPFELGSRAPPPAGPVGGLALKSCKRVGYGTGRGSDRVNRVSLPACYRKRFRTRYPSDITFTPIRTQQLCLRQHGLHSFFLQVGRVAVFVEDAFHHDSDLGSRALAEGPVDGHALAGPW